MSLGEILKEFGIKLTMVFDKKKAEEAEKSVAAIGKEMRSVAVQVASASAALIGLAGISSHNSRELQQNSAMLGINVERLQELEYAARVAAGVSRDELMGALEGVSSTLDKARHSDVMAAQSLIRLGVPLSMVTDRTVTADQVMGQLAESFRKIQDPMAKARLASEVFGGAGARLLPLLNKGAAGMAAMGKEARALGLVMSKTSIDQGAEFDRQFTKIWLVLKNITFLVGNELIKYLRPMVGEFQKWVVANRQFIAQGIAGVVKELGTYLGMVFKTVKFVVERFQALIGVLGGTGRVAHVVAIAMGAITAAKIVSALGGLVQGFRAVSAVLGIMSIQSLAIGAGLLALILVVQDLFSNDSIIKEWFNTFKKDFPNLAGLATDFVDVMVQGAGLIAEGWKNVWSWLQPIKEFFSSGILGDALKKADEFVGFLRGGTIGSKIFDAVDSLTGGSASGVAPTPAAAGAAGGGVNQTNQISAAVTVNVPPGTSAAAATGIVSGGVEDALHKMLRHTRNQAVGGVAY